MKVILEMYTKLYKNKCFINESSVKVNMRIQRDVHNY